MKFPTLLALLFAAALCTGCEKGVPASINADSDQAASDLPVPPSPHGDQQQDFDPAQWHRADSGRYGNTAADDNRYGDNRYGDNRYENSRNDEETPSVADALSDEAGEIAQRLKQRATKKIDSLSDRFEQTLDRGLDKLDEASRASNGDSDER